MKRKYFALQILLIGLLCLILGFKTTQAARVSLDYSSLELFEGEKDTIKLEGTKSKVSWQTSNKKVALVKKKGKTSATVTAKKKGKATITAKVGKKKYKCKVVVWAIPEEDTSDDVNQTPNIAPAPTPMPTPQEVYNKNFDAIVAAVKRVGKFTDYGDYCINGWVSVSMSGNKIEINEGYGVRGSHGVIITRGSNIAMAHVETNGGTASAMFDISTFKGDMSDDLLWSNNPSETNRREYNSTIANIMKKVATEKVEGTETLSMGGYSFRDIGFTSYLF